MDRPKGTFTHAKKTFPPAAVPWILLLAALCMICDSQAGIMKGKVNSIHDNIMELDVGAERRLNLGDVGRVYYNILVDGKEQPIFIARFRITHLSEGSCMAQIQQKTPPRK